MTDASNSCSRISEVDRRIGRIIRLVRTQKGRTRQALANELETTACNVADWEEGKTAISVENLRQIATFLETPVNHFFGFPPPRFPEELEVDFGDMELNCARVFDGSMSSEILLLIAPLHPEGSND